MHTSRRDRRAKNLGAAKSAFALNDEFGYFNSQVSDKEAFRHHLGAPAGEETQLELKELSQNTPAALGNTASPAPPDVKSKISKFEKENSPLSAPAGLSTVTRPELPPTKRARVEMPIKTEPHSLTVPAELEMSLVLRISQLENEVMRLRRENEANQAAAERVIQDLKLEWRHIRGDCIAFQSRVGGLGVRMNRVEGHVEQIVEHLPGHRGWHSEVGSDFDPDATLADVDFEDGSQPVEVYETWTEGQNWGGPDVDESKEVDA